nr:CcoQ/FixQ family Cbb3-type cytochrome c oxidase assembly chaperone [Polynucleobacter tropicus]
MVPYLSAFSTSIGLIFFLGIVWWAWSPRRKKANQESAELPFDLPDEFSKEKS